MKLSEWLKQCLNMANCIHPTNLKKALLNDTNKNHPQLARFKGIQANASILSVDEFDNCRVLQQDDFQVMINEMQLLRKQFDFKIFGGCCGTNNEFIDNLAKRIKLPIP